MSENKNFFRASAEDFKKIPGSPVAYWVSRAFVDAFEFPSAEMKVLKICKGCFTGNNELYLRLWHEVGFEKIVSDKWHRYSKGGQFRRWYGNSENVILWENNGRVLKSETRAGMGASQYYGKAHFVWSGISTGLASFRYDPDDVFFDDVSPSLVFDENVDCNLLAILNSKPIASFLRVIAPTMHFQAGDIKMIPMCCVSDREVDVTRLVNIAKKDWDAFEGSWDFTVNPLVAARNVSGASDESEFQLSVLYAAVREKWAKDCEEMRRLETENNRIFIEAYGLQDELTPEVPWHEITLTCNPWYRYGVKVDSGQCAVGSAASDHCTLPTDHLLEERLKGDTVKELISYAVGCMMGRYSLEKPGLILADQGAQISDQWLVVSGQLVLRGKVAECVRKELQRIDCLAEGDGSCGRSVSTGETAPDGGTVCIVGSASSGGGFNSVECRRGAGAEYDAGLHELSDNGTRVVLRDGNTIVDLCSAEVLDAIASGSGAELVRRGWKDAERIDWKTIHSSLTTSHFSPDEDGIIPILDNDWFADDIVTRFKEFIKVAFGEVHFFENMAWIEEALGKNLRDYFTKDFYKDHLQRYQNRPIYWLFQSPKGAFRALVYMHRYKPDMVGGVLGYLRSFQTKVENQLGVATQIASDESKSSTERVRANKEVVKYSKMQKELDEYEKNVLYPLSTERIEIDLDDGVKVNYKKFGVALRKVAALEGRSAE